MLDRLLALARTSRSGVVVVRGEAGIGKSALLDHARERAESSGFRVESSTGVESETQFAFAGLHQLCAPALDRIDGLPEPQRTALAVAFGTRAGAAPDRFLVGLATLNLLADVAETAPLLAVVDDAQWLDPASAQVLAFVARRVAAERLALVFAVRDGEGDAQALAALPELRVRPLGNTDAQQLLAEAVRVPLDGVVSDRIVAEARGNPLALLELPLSMGPGRLAGGFELPDASNVPRRIEDSFRLRSRSLPIETQQLLLLAAAEPTGDAALLWRAADQLAIPREASAPAEAAGLLEISARVRFRHPLARSAVYGSATAHDRRRAHGALAAATDPRSSPDRRAWHRAHAVPGADEEVAAELERSAGRARARGGLAASAAFLQRAAELTPDAERRASRALDAAHAKHESGASDAASDLLDLAETGPLEPLPKARLQLLRARIAFHRTRGGDATALLLDAARTLAPRDAALSRETYLHAFEASFHSGRLSDANGSRDTARAARDAPAAPTPPRTVDLLLDGLSVRFTRGYVASVPALRRALAAFRAPDGSSGDDDRRWLWMACHVAAMLWDDEAIYELASRDVELARRSGALATLPGALNALSSVLVLTGDLARAAELVAEERDITELAGAPPLPNARLILAAWSGAETETLELSDQLVSEATARGEGSTLGLAEVALAALHNGLGNHDRALAAARSPVEHDELTFSSIALPELIEAAVRAGRPELATEAMAQLSRRARASGTPWALGVEARSRALLSTGATAEEHYRDAIARLAQCRMATHRARAHLVYGEWLSREGRRRDAADQLRTSHDMLSRMGAEAFAARAARGLRHIGESPPTRGPHPTDELTPQELHIARLVATGATSAEVAGQLFLSPRTVEAHLRSIFRKLRIGSRRQLRDLLPPRSVVRDHTTPG